MLSLLSSAAMAIIVHGALLGTVLGLLYRLHTLTVHTAKLNIDAVAMALFVREHLSSLEYQVSHLQAASKVRTNAGVTLEYL